MISTLIIDDQIDAIEVLSRHVIAHERLELKTTFTNPIEALKYLEHNSIDLVFIDVQMPDLSGIEFLEMVSQNNNVNLPHFIFVTGYANYALEGFELGVVDFLLKPVTFKRFNIAINRYISIFGDKKRNNTKMPDFFFAELVGLKQKIKFSEIICIEGAGNYISVFRENDRLTLYQSLSSLRSLLDPKEFMQVHKSYVVNINSVEFIRGNDLYIMHKSKEMKIPMSITYKSEVLKRLGIQ
jgi:two-component system, LytTR family, response regulator